MSYIIISPNAEKRINIAISLCKKNAVDDLDITRLTLKENTLSIGIKDVKEMMQKIYLKPLKGKNKAVIIEDADLLTLDAQNTLLKVLEEPPAHTTIILIGGSSDSFLPTVLSRCLIIILDADKPSLDPKDLAEYSEVFHQLAHLNPALAIELAEKFSKNKNETPEIIKKLLITGKELFLNSINSNSKDQLLYAKVLSGLQNSHRNLTRTNINTRLELEHCFLSLTQSLH